MPAGNACRSIVMQSKNKCVGDRCCKKTDVHSHCVLTPENVILDADIYLGARGDLLVAMCELFKRMSK